MTTTLTLARLHDLRLSGMAQALTQQQEQSSTYEALPFLERLGLLVEQECLVRDQRKQDVLRNQVFTFLRNRCSSSPEYAYFRPVQFIGGRSNWHTFLETAHNLGYQSRYFGNIL